MGVTVRTVFIDEWSGVEWTGPRVVYRGREERRGDDFVYGSWENFTEYTHGATNFIVERWILVLQLTTPIYRHGTYLDWFQLS